MIQRTKTLVIGANGFLGNVLYRAYQSLGVGGIGTHYKRTEHFQRLDLSNPDLSSLEWNPKEYSHALLLASAFNMWTCEANPTDSFRCDVLGNLSLARQCINLGIIPVFFSTDRVFDGQGDEIYTEESTLTPSNEYGRQKATLETMVKSEFSDRSLMLRLSKVLSFLPEDRDALIHMVQRSLEREKDGVIWDQIFCPLLVTDVVRAVLELQARNLSGVFNICGTEIWSRRALYQGLAQALQLPMPPGGKPILSQQRTVSTILSSAKLQRMTNLSLKPLSKSIEELSGAFV